MSSIAKKVSSSAMSSAVSGLRVAKHASVPDIGVRVEKTTIALLSCP
jgi:hypothetical protein